MTISSYATLKTAAESWTERTYTDTIFGEFVANVTDVLNRGMMAADQRTWIVPPCRARAMLTSVTLTLASGAVALPGDWLEFERLWVDANAGDPLSLVPLQEYWRDGRTRQSGTPSIYTIDGQTLRTAPAGNGEVEASYFARLTSPASGSDTNVILTNHARVYLQGVLVEASEWEEASARADRERIKFGASVAALNAEMRSSQTSGSLLVMRPTSAP